MTSQLIGRNAQQALIELDRALDEGVEVGQLAEQIVGYFRDLMAAQVGCDADLMLQTEVPDPVGLAFYAVDVYPCRLVATPDGRVATEGETFTRVSPGPYPIAYRAIVPKKEQCSNLLVPVCLSATHIAFGSIRMEPVFMVLGQSSATAAALAIEKDLTVQELEYANLRDLLWAGEQELNRD